MLLKCCFKTMIVIVMYFLLIYFQLAVPAISFDEVAGTASLIYEIHLKDNC